MDLNLHSLGLPDAVLFCYQGGSVRSLFNWQEECLKLEGVLSGKSIVYSAPTSAGKTLVAEVLMLKRVLDTRLKALFVLPYVSVAREKTSHLQRQFVRAGVRVESFIGGSRPCGDIQSWDIAVCTIEKANSLVNKLIGDNSLDMLGCVVVDELHTVGDQSRGCLLELLLTKLRFLSRSRVDKENRLQFIGMSATLPNPHSFAQWLDATYYASDFRPVPLDKFLKIGNDIVDNTMQKVRILSQDLHLPNDQDGVAGLCLETVLLDRGVLIFCSTRNWTEKLAENIAKQFCALLTSSLPSLTELNRTLSTVISASRISEFLNGFKKKVAIMDEILVKCLSMGVAFHHAGLTVEEREEVERGFRYGVVKVLVATSTLCSGVNLPAEKVIIRSLPRAAAASQAQIQYRQMAGRCGRQGMNIKGECILVCQPSEIRRGLDLINGELEAMRSGLLLTKDIISTSTSGNKLANEKQLETTSAFKRALLEIFASGLAKSALDVEEYLMCTLLAAQISVEHKSDSNEFKMKIHDAVCSSISFLSVNEFIKPSTEDNFIATQLATATLNSALSPTEALSVFQDLQKSRKALSLENELHLVYLVTPLYENQWNEVLDWTTYERLWRNLPEDQSHVGKLVGIQEQFLVRAAHGMLSSTKCGSASAKNARLMSVHQRFYAALALHELINEVPLAKVAQKFNCNRGFLQTLQQQASTYAGMVTVFCDRLGWWSLRCLLSDMAERLAFGVRKELSELVRIDGVDGSRARAFHALGFSTIASIASALPEEIARVLSKAVPFESSVYGSTKNGAMHSWLAGHPELTLSEATEKILREAQKILMTNLSEFGIAIDTALTHGLVPVTKPPPIGPTPQHGAVSSPVAFCEQDNQVPQDGRPAPDCEPVPSPPAESVAENAANIVSVSSKDETLPLPEATSATPTAGVISSFLSSSEVSLLFDDSLSDSLLLANLASSVSRISISPQQNNCTMNVQTTFRKRSTTKVSDASALAVVDASTPLMQHSNITSTLKNSYCDDENNYENENAGSKSRSKSKRTENLFMPGNNSEPVKLDYSASNDMQRRSCCHSFSTSPPKFCLNFSAAADAAVDLSSDSLNDFVLPTTQIQRLVDEEKASGDSDTECKLSEEAHAAVLPDVGSASSPELLFSDDEPSLGITTENNTTKDCCSEIPQNASSCSTQCCDQVPSTSASLSPCLADITNVLSQSKAKQITAIKPKRTLQKNSQSTPSPMLRKKTKTRLMRNDLPLPVAGASKESSEVHFKIGQLNVVEVTTQESLTDVLGLERGNTDSVAIALAFGQKGLLDGVAFCTGDESTVYYVKDLLLNGFVKTLLGTCCRLSGNDNAAIQSTALICFDAKLVMRSLRCFDPKISERGIPFKCCHTAAWLLNPEQNGAASDLTVLVCQYLPSKIAFLEETKSLCVNSARNRACVTSSILCQLSQNIELILKQRNLLELYSTVELHTLRVLCTMESTGIAFDTAAARALCDQFLQRHIELQNAAFQLAGRSFSLPNHSEVAKVLFKELKLPSQNISSATTTGKRQQHYSTSKPVLQKLKDFHALPGIILEWRQVHNALNTGIYPLLKDGRHCESSACDRIYGCYETFTTTGRITMYSPNLQVLPKGGFAGLFFDLAVEDQVEPSFEEGDVCLRNLFIASQGYCLLSADYSQIELRILAHFSQESKLLSILNADSGDVFKIVAATWKNIPEADVTAEVRQQAKQICYGIIYGMGPKLLAEHLHVDVAVANEFLNSFREQFQRVWFWINETVHQCRSRGCTESLKGRRRYLPNLNTNNAMLRAQAERQAINTCIQGSAADIFKSALCRIQTSLSHNYAYEDARLILQLHDEVLLEVKSKFAQKVAALIKTEMESASCLSVPCPVQLKMGSNWGSLHLYNC